MDPHVARHPLKKTHTAHTIAMFVQPRRERRHPNLTRQRADQTTRDARLSRDANLGHPVARSVIHAARRHDAQNLADHATRHHFLAGDRVNALVRQGRGHDRQVPRRYQKRAGPRVALHDHPRILGEYVVAAEHVGDRQVPVGVVQLRATHPLINLQPTASKRRQPVNDPLEALTLGPIVTAHQGMRRQRASINHGVERATFLVQGHLVESLTGRFHADTLQDIAKTTVFQGFAID